MVNNNEQMWGGQKVHEKMIMVSIILFCYTERMNDTTSSVKEDFGGRLKDFLKEDFTKCYIVSCLICDG